MKKTFIKILLVALCLILATAGLFGCGDKNEGDKGNPIVEFTFSTQDTARFVLYPDQAPITVQNFLRYVQEGFYVGTIIHRIDYQTVRYNNEYYSVPYVVQGGGYESVADSISGKHKETHETIKGEFAANGVDNNVKHVRGAISMARTNEVDSASSEFFFCPIAMTSFDGSYAAFGQALDEDSINVVLKLATVETMQVSSMQYVPVETISITSVAVIGYQKD